MDDRADALDALDQDPEDLDGHTIEELADYLDAGRTPADPSIDSSPACLHALAALERLRRLTADELLRPGDDDQGDGAWLDRMMSRITSDARQGADFTLTTGTAGTTLLMTEGALRGVIRATGDDQPEFLVGRILFDGDLSDAARPITVEVHVVVMLGTVIPAAVDRLRDRIRAELSRHTEFQRVRIDIVVDDLDTTELDDVL